MASLSDLFLYKKEIEILHPVTSKPVKKLWVRILGDNELSKAYRISRVASAAKRAALRDATTEDYKDEVLGVAELSTQEQIELIKTARSSNIIAEAQATVERPDAPELPEIAVNPDAPTLEELEKLDNTSTKEDEEYKKKIQEYIDSKITQLEAELKELSTDELLATAQYEVSNILPFSVFIDELNSYKAFYGTYQDKACKVPEFQSIEEYKNLPKAVKDQILEAISTLEINGDDIKN